MDMRNSEVTDENGRTSPPFQHLGQDLIHHKSILALQELQNAVGALFEFRDVVVETFPQLKAKLKSQGAGNSAGSSNGGKWEPGIRVRRKPKEDPPRSRSNSRSKSCSVVAIQDSGFCTAESSGSKKTMEGGDDDDEESDELWCLLELIQTKGTKLKLEVESMKDSCIRRSQSLDRIISPTEDVRQLIQDKEILLEKVAELEEEGRRREEETFKMSRQVADLLDEKRRLEDTLNEPLHVPPPPRLPSGNLDGLVSSPSDIIPCPGGIMPDREVTAAILKEKNIIELQRHLLTTTHKNQLAQTKLEKLCKLKETLEKSVEKMKEDNEDLRFQLEEKSIELEGTRAMVRLLKSQNISSQSRSTSVDSSDPTTTEDNSSTESAHGNNSAGRKQKPSRIPLMAKVPSAPPNSLNKSKLTPPVLATTPPKLKTTIKPQPVTETKGLEADSLERCTDADTFDSLDGYFDSIDSKNSSRSNGGEALADSLDLV